MGVEAWKQLRCGGQGKTETPDPALSRTPVRDQGCSSVGRDWVSMQEAVASTPGTTKTARPQSTIPVPRRWRQEEQKVKNVLN